MPGLSTGSAFAAGAGLLGAFAAYHGMKKINQTAGRLSGYGDSGFLAGALTETVLTGTGAHLPGMGYGPTPNVPYGRGAALASLGVGAGAAVGTAAYMMNLSQKGAKFNMPQFASNNYAARAANGVSRIVGKGASKMGAGNSMMAAGAGLIVGAATIDMANRSVNRLAQRMLQEGTASFRPASKSTPPTRRSVRGSATSSRVARYSGAPRDMGWNGSSVLSLHETGGAGGVYR